MLEGRATAEGTAAFAARPRGLAADFYSEASGLAVSSLGLGTYLGEEDAATDRGYEESIAAALAGGINHLDTAINYRSMASERCVGRALAASGVPRAGVLVATKGGYVPSRGVVDRLIREKKISKDDVVRGIHSLAPRYLEEMLATSRANLGLATIDVYYLHNPETQLAAVSQDVFLGRCRAAFELLEAARRKGEVVAYGTATWNGYRRPLGAPDALDLEKIVEQARAAAGSDDHGFRWVQLPVNLEMTEALAQKTQRVRGEAVSLLEAAKRLGVNVVASGTIAQAHLAGALPARAKKVAWPAEVATNAGRAILFVRSVPGIATALVGMSRVVHVTENLAAARAAKLPRDRVSILAGLA